jgi:membrane protease YdiL (CAAX protease family)
LGEGLFAAGLITAVVAAAVHSRRWGLDPFRHGRVRGNRLTPALMLAPMLAYVLSYLMRGPVQAWLSQGEPVRAAQQVRNNLAQIAGAACCLWVGHRCFRGGLRGFLLGPGHLWQQWLRPLIAALAYVLAASSLCDLTYLLTEQVIRLFRPDYEFYDHRVIQALRMPGEPPWAPLVLWLGAAVVAPIAEEGFFRGLVQTMILRATHQRGLAVAATALVFGMAHADQPHVLPAMTVFGVVIGLQYERSGALVGPIAAHALFNLKTLVWEWWSRTPPV